ncbi:LysR family transcriptional regulator [Agarivorans sp. 1_MG-2023]|uniref:LysR family transcriptional regulator n=1 Tax=Agarivorans sp. 1_MG-2023 TaxID=3062634 RepID=UPI0026E1B79E|nr:LysR family transcriptional regulator [Agarivorans sp. 1_MG-2023]MDO6765681.1 LysR family transcriptional regulator [Agarivorans sp. 1_MG-2023]
MFSIEQVTVLVASADLGSFSAAARSMGKSHSAVSIAINNLEDDLGVQLFDRSTKFPTLTEDGLRFYNQSQLLLRQVERMQAAAQSSIDQVEQLIRIGLGELVPFAMVETVLEKTASKFPHTRLSVVRNEHATLVDMLENKELNLVVAGCSQGTTRSVDFFSIAELPLAFICSPDSPLADLPIVDNETLLSSRQLMCTSMLNNPSLRNYGSVSPDTWQITNQEDMLKLVEQGIGWAGVPKVLAEERAAMGTLKIFKPEFSHTEQSILIDLLAAPASQRGPVETFLIESLQAIEV